jgi:hypothetical protein
MQKAVSATSLKYQIEQQKITEMVLKALHMPTRSELDDAYRTIYELRKQVKALTKKVDTLTALPEPTAPSKKRKVAPRRKPAAPAKKAETKVENTKNASV